MQVWGITDRGAVRQQNQDAYAAQVLEDGSAVLTNLALYDSRTGLSITADEKEFLAI